MAGAIASCPEKLREDEEAFDFGAYNSVSWY
jgi:hypothetical protein